MRITRAVITAAGEKQRHLPLQTLVDCDGQTKALLAILVGSAVKAGIEEVCVVVCPGDQGPYARVLHDLASRVTFVEQTQPRGYGDAVLRARPFVGDTPFLHLIGDHVFISTTEQSCVQQIMSAATANDCAVSAVVATRESMLPRFGAVGGRRVAGSPNLFEIERVIEKPTPTEAEQSLVVPGLRAGHYLCFSGLHVLTPLVMETLAAHAARLANDDRLELSPALDELAHRERYLALDMQGLRYAVDTRYGLLMAQLALALNGCDREEVLTELCTLLAERDLARRSER
jgi:UTP--glucose-1-phosphate uridylyltransferase